MFLSDRGAAAGARRRVNPVWAGVWLALLLLTLAILQTSFFGFFPLFGAVPDLVLLGVISVALMMGERAGGICGLAGGVLLDSLGGTGVALLPLFYFLLGYFVGYYGKERGERFSGYLLFLGLSLAARGAITTLYAGMTYRSINFLKLLWRAVLPEMLATALIGFLLFWPLRALCRRLNGRNAR